MIRMSSPSIASSRIRRSTQSTAFKGNEESINGTPKSEKKRVKINLPISASPNTSSPIGTTTGLTESLSTSSPAASTIKPPSSGLARLISASSFSNRDQGTTDTQPVDSNLLPKVMTETVKDVISNYEELLKTLPKVSDEILSMHYGTEELAKELQVSKVHIFSSYLSIKVRQLLIPSYELNRLRRKLFLKSTNRCKISLIICPLSSRIT